MQQEGWLTSSWQVTEKGRKAKFYAITERGTMQLVVEKEKWLRLTRGSRVCFASADTSCLMSWYARIINVFRTRQLSEELDDELAFHVAERTDELVAGGMTERQARREAMQRFGNYTVQKERTREMDIIQALETALADLRYGLRQLRLAPGFTIVAIMSLALGIGANTAIFQLIDAIRLRSLPVHEPSQLAAVDSAPQFFTSGWYSSRNRAFTYAQFEQIRARHQAFSGLLAFGNTRFNLSRSGESRYAQGLYVTANYLDVLGVNPLLGRGFSAEDNKPGCAEAGALLSYSFWQREFGGDNAAISKTVSLDGRSFPVIGVTPQGFVGVEPAQRFDVALPLCADALLSSDGKGAQGGSPCVVAHAYRSIENGLVS
ncbi:MAG: ABC transporter permease [Bryobacteraceae bacterium]